MFNLKLQTDPRWVNIAEKNLEEILTDHAYCEQKAANFAISIVIGFPEKSKLVSEMIKIAQEEISHFKMVHDLIIRYGLKLGKERKDKYVNDLKKNFKKGVDRDKHLVNKLLQAAIIEARSCERFKLLSETLKDKTLAVFYKKLMISEANHYTTFLKLARKYGKNKKEVELKWENFLVYEAQIIKKLGNKEFIHG